jgi:hypothetical protein
MGVEMLKSEYLGQSLGLCPQPWHGIWRGTVPSLLCNLVVTGGEEQGRREREQGKSPGKKERFLWQGMSKPLWYSLYPSRGKENKHNLSNTAGPRPLSSFYFILPITLSIFVIVTIVLIIKIIIPGVSWIPFASKDH